jgi:TPR repeat protein
MFSIARSVFVSCFTRRILYFASCALFLLAVLLPPSHAQQNPAPVVSSCVSAAMIRQMVRGGNSIRVSPSVERSHDVGAAENEKGIAFAQTPESVRTLDQAHRWFEKAARKGYAPAQVNLAVLSLAGWGTTPNAGTALYWLREAARQQYPLAYFDLGVLYLEGCGVPRDHAEAFRYFEQGADAGDAPAEMNLGYLYDQGRGVAQDRSQAAAWYRKAAENGVAQAQYNLADLYVRGEGVPRDEATAFAWFQKAAVQGHTGARVMLGTMYAEGRGTGKNLQAAYEWISAAVLQGDARGAETLAIVERDLTPEQLAKSKARAQLLAQSARLRGDAEVALLQ